jgi:hypothetical protein
MRFTYFSKPRDLELDRLEVRVGVVLVAVRLPKLKRRTVRRWAALSDQVPVAQRHEQNADHASPTV